MSGLTELYGLKIIQTNVITKEIQKRKHRKKRINKKWLKRYRYKTVPDDDKIIITHGCIFATPNATIKMTKLINGGSE